jgi:hypothetical protein
MIGGKVAFAGTDLTYVNHVTQFNTYVIMVLAPGVGLTTTKYSQITSLWIALGSRS